MNLKYEHLDTLLTGIENDAESVAALYYTIGANNMDPIKKRRETPDVRFGGPVEELIITALKLYKFLHKDFMMNTEKLLSAHKCELSFIMDMMCDENDKMFYAIALFNELSPTGPNTSYPEKTVKWAESYISDVGNSSVQKITNLEMRIKSFDRRLTDSLGDGSINATEFTKLKQRLTTLRSIKMCVLERWL